MALQFNPPEWLIQEYVKRKQPAEIMNEGVGNAINTYATLKKQQDDQKIKQRLMDLKEQELSLAKDKNAREQGEYARNYAPAELPGAGGAYNQYSTQDMGQAQGATLTQDAQLRSLLTQSGSQPTLQPNMGPTPPPNQPPMSPVIQHFESMRTNSGIGMGQNNSLAPAPKNPQEEANLQHANKYPQGFKGALADKRTSLDEQYTPEEINQILSGQPLNRPMSARGLGRVQTALGQAGTQGRFETKLEQGKKEKGAAAELKVGDTLKQVREVRSVLSDLTKRHSELAGTVYAGSPLEAGLGRAVGGSTGGGLGTAKARAYDSIAKGMVGRMKTLTGNVGMLTEFDQQRLEKLLPGLSDNKETAKEKLKIMNDILDMVESGDMKKLDTYLRSIGVKTQEASSSSGTSTGMEGLSSEELQRIIDGEE